MKADFCACSSRSACCLCIPRILSSVLFGKPYVKTTPIAPALIFGVHRRVRGLPDMAAVALKFSAALASKFPSNSITVLPQRFPFFTSLLPNLVQLIVRIPKLRLHSFMLYALVSSVQNETVSRMPIGKFSLWPRWLRYLNLFIGLVETKGHWH